MISAGSFYGHCDFLNIVKSLNELKKHKTKKGLICLLNKVISTSRQPPYRSKCTSLILRAFFGLQINSHNQQVNDALAIKEAKGEPI